MLSTFFSLPLSCFLFGCVKNIQYFLILFFIHFTHVFHLTIIFFLIHATFSYTIDMKSWCVCGGDLYVPIF